jgi:8-oxo-dGTP pyrophosphatase MutT (NUDIX family)
VILNSEVVTEAPRASATLVLLRDSPRHELEVFLLRRHAASAVLGGVFVFPGGKLDASDCQEAWISRLDRSPQSLHVSLGEAQLDVNQASGLYIAAIREALEECGVLFAHSDSLTPFQTHEVQRQQLQQELHAGADFAQLMLRERLVLNTQAMAGWSRWITPLVPSVSNKRFDTRFFVAVLPKDQEPVHDNVEAVDSVWLTPRDALIRYWEKDISLAPPQIMSLVNLLSYPDANSVLQSAKQKVPSVVFPETFEDDGVRTICYPGDARHSVQKRALRGPTRLRFVNGRFEPAGGLNDFLNPI